MKCKHCGMKLRKGESIEDHYEVCGAMTDEEVEDRSADGWLFESSNNFDGKDFDMDESELEYMERDSNED